MTVTKHQQISGSEGTHVVIFKFDGIHYVFERKVFISRSEYR